MKNKGSAVVWVIIIIAILVIAGGIYFYSQPKESVVVPTQNQVATSTATTSTNTTGWQTYTDSQYGFSIEYPGSVQPQEGYAVSGKGVKFSFPSSDSNRVTKTLGILLATTSINNLGTAFNPPASCKDFGPNATSSVAINGIVFMKGDTSYPATGQRITATEYCVIKGEVAYKLTPSIEYPTDDATYDGFNPAFNVNNDVILNQMIYTFKFTN